MDYVTAGRMSKLTYPTDTMLNVIDEVRSEIIDDAVEDAVREAADPFIKTLNWIAVNDPEGEGDVYWYSEQAAMRAQEALDREGPI